MAPGVQHSSLLAIAFAVALAGCALQPGRGNPAVDAAVDNAVHAWIVCGKRNAAALARSRIAIKIAAYAAIDACAAERSACGKAMYAQLGAARTAEIIAALDRIRTSSARDLEAQIADERAKMTLTQR